MLHEQAFTRHNILWLVGITSHLYSIFHVICTIIPRYHGNAISTTPRLEIALGLPPYEYSHIGSTPSTPHGPNWLILKWQLPITFRSGPQVDIPLRHYNGIFPCRSYWGIPISSPLQIFFSKNRKKLHFFTDSSFYVSNIDAYWWTGLVYTDQLFNCVDFNASLY